jgi:hypothetical protein
MVYTDMAWWYCPLPLVCRGAEYSLNWHNTFHHVLMAWYDPILRKLVNNYHKISFLSTPDGEFMVYTDMDWWYCPLPLVSREVEFILNWYNTFHHLLMAW